MDRPSFPEWVTKYFSSPESKIMYKETRTGKLFTQFQVLKWYRRAYKNEAGQKISTL